LQFTRLCLGTRPRIEFRKCFKHSSRRDFTWWLIGKQGYALVTAKGGQKLKKPGDLDRAACESWAPAPPDGNNNETCRKIVRTGDQAVSILMMTNSRFGPTLSSTSRGETTTSDYEFFRITMPTLAEELTGLIGHALANGDGRAIVIDRTGIQGPWDVVINLSFGEFDTVLSGTLASLERQGLRLEKTSIPAETLFVDSMDKTPTENQ